MRITVCALTIPMLLLLASAVLHAAEPRVITSSITLDQDARIDTPLVIGADGITIDGNGATVVGPGRAGNLESFRGVGVLAEGRSRVTIRNLRVHGFESGLVARKGEGWTIEGCDFSGNYHDPSYGWGDGERVGGIILTGMSKCTIRGNRANNNWNGLDLWESHDNTIEKNNFSHCSNVCLKLWLSCRNKVIDNNLSYGLRISPGEVHARDSTSVLIETGSDDNHFERNDITHGGDGVFIRVLNGWCSRRNVFIENDCSYANNNGFEAWSPDNTYIRNKANHCSYGFWLGGSDHTVLIGNEAAYNGQPDGFHNAPEPDFHHGGIVIVGGSGTHTIIEGNHCHHNNGAGIVFRGDLGTRGDKWKMYHLIVQNNRLENNRWGLFARFTDWLDLSSNTYKDNRENELLEEVTDLTRWKDAPAGMKAPKAAITGPNRAAVGEKVVFDASKSSDPAGGKLQFRWEVGGTEYRTARVEHTFDTPGFHRVGVTVSNGHLCGLAFVDFYAVPSIQEIGTEGDASRWGWTMGNNAESRGRVVFRDAKEAVVGRTAVHLRPQPYMGADVAAVFPQDRKAAWDLTKTKTLAFWLRFQNPNNGGFQGPNPIVRLHAGKAAYSYTPAYQGMPRNLLGDLPYSEARHGWLYVTIPLGGGDAWLRSETFDGARPPHVNNALKFVTIQTPIETQSASALASDGKRLYCAATDGECFAASEDGHAWKDLASPRSLRGGAAWINGMLAFWPGGGSAGSLFLRYQHPQKDASNNDAFRLVAYDIAKDAWSWLPTLTAMEHGTAVVGDHLFGIAHAVGGNYGGPICRVNLAEPGPVDERSVLAPVRGKDAWWFSRAAQFAVVDGQIYAIKNDWTTPQPKNPEEIGDRLLRFDPGAYAPSSFAGGNRWDAEKWKEARTPTTDLGPLPFEIGHGAALVALPPSWCAAVGTKGGLFVVAGCSPSNHEGYGPASAAYAIYDIASGRFTTGVLPDVTATGTSAAMHRGRLYIKRGGLNYGPSNSELWEVTPLKPAEARAAEGQAKREQMSLKNVDCVSLQFDSIGHEPFDVWVDGLAFE